MAQIFHRSVNTIARVTILGAGFFAAGTGWALAVYIRSPIANNQGVVYDQQVPFSHEHHYTGLGIDCRYCHNAVEVAAYPGMPATKTCMNCHQQMWVGSELLAPVRESWRTGEPLVWNRVHQLAEFVYFNHSAHVNKGFGCNTCHGPINHMPLVWQNGTLQMEWCLECHREPERFIRPKSEIFNMEWEPGPDQIAEGEKLCEQYHVRKNVINCSTCHR